MEMQTIFEAMQLLNITFENKENAVRQKQYVYFLILNDLKIAICTFGATSWAIEAERALSDITLETIIIFMGR